QTTSNHFRQAVLRKGYLPGKPFSVYLREFIQGNCFGPDEEKNIALTSLKNEVEAAREMILEALLLCAKTTVTRIYKEYLSGPKKNAGVICRHISELVTRVVDHEDGRRALDLAVEDLLEEGVTESVIERELKQQLKDGGRDDLAALVAQSISDMAHAQVEKLALEFFPMGIRGASQNGKGNADSQKPQQSSPKPFAPRPPRVSARKKRQMDRSHPGE
ncbi:MAG: hypothetical protein AAB588_05955, partial [Patescibacteria group bacterium]